MFTNIVGTSFIDSCIVERDRFGAVSVMIRGGISDGVKSQLIVTAGNLTALRYRDEVHHPTAVPLAQQVN